MIFVVSELYYPEEISTGYIMTKICEGLADNFPVKVITCKPNYSEKLEALGTEVRNNVLIERLNIPFLDKNRYISRAIRTLWVTVALSLKTMKQVKRGDTVFIVTNPAPLLLVMCIYCKIIRAKLIVLVHDVFPENLLVINLLNNKSLIYKLAKYTFDALYKKCDHIIVIGRDMAEVFNRKIGNHCPPISIITNWADTNEVFPEDRSENKIISEYNLKDKFIVQFAGNIGRVQGIEDIVDVAQQLQNENIHFIIIGCGAKKSFLLNEITSRSISNITVLDALPRNTQNLFLNACDVALVSLASGMAGLGVPSKTYNILASGKPIIAIVEPHSEIALMVKEENIGWVVTPGDLDTLAATILEAKCSSNHKEMGMRSRTVAENNYSLDIIIHKYKELFTTYV